MYSLECRKCSYKFTSKNPKPRCPYCGKEEVGLEKTADDFLQDTLGEIEGMDEERKRRS